MKNNPEDPPMESNRFKPPVVSKYAIISVPLIWSKQIESSWTMMKAFDIRLALSRALFLMTTNKLSDEYCLLDSFQTIGFRYIRTSESRSLYTRESQEACMSFLNTFTFLSPSRNPILVESTTSTPTVSEGEATVSAGACKAWT